MSAVTDVADEFAQKLKDEDEEQMRIMARRWAGVVDSIERDFNTLASELVAARDAGKTLSKAKLRRLKSYQRKFVRAQREIDRYAEWASDRITKRQLDMRDLGVTNSVDMIDAAYEDAGAAGLGFFINPENVDVLIGFAGDGTPLSEMLKASFPETWEQITDELVEGIAKGLSPTEIAKNISKALNVPLNRALSIARTEQLRAYREASRQTYEQSGAVDFWKRRAVKDSRTCIGCLVFDGRLFPVSQTLIDHPNGRCFMVPWVKGTPEPTWETGQDWFMAQSPEAQKKQLGPGKFDAFKGGEFTFDDMAKVIDDPTWGEFPVPAALKDLVEVEE